MEKKCEMCENTKRKIMSSPLFSVQDQKEIVFLNNCNICAKSFKSQNGLTMHIKTFHGGQKDFKCESCGKSFFDARNLKEHIQTIHKGTMGAVRQLLFQKEF